MATTDKSIAEAIQARMALKKMSTNELHKATGIPYNTLKARLNTGYKLEIAELRLISDALGTTPQGILRKAESQKTKDAA